MTKKHFIALANLIAALPEHPTRADVAHALALELRSTNPRFDVVRFLTACGIKATRVAA